MADSYAPSAISQCLDPLNLTWIMPAEESDLILTRPPTLSKLGGFVFGADWGKIMKAIIIANGQIHDSDLYRSLVAPTDLVICANGGASNALALGLQP